MNDMPQSDDAVPDEPYEPPAVVVLGTFAEHTQGDGGDPNDAFAGFLVS